MPRPAKPARLYLRERSGRESQYVILDRGREVGTGCGPGDERQAEKIFAEYLARTHKPAAGHPNTVPVADVLNAYGESKHDAASPETIGHRIDRLLEYFGGWMAGKVDEQACKDYVAYRVAGEIRRPVTEETARSELQALAAAMNHGFSSKRLTHPVTVWLPAKSEAKDRWLTRSEAARLIAGALGFRYNKRKKRFTRDGAPSYHVARFILIALYTATRHESVLMMQWERNPDGGWFDIDHGHFHRRGYRTADTKKRRPPAPIPDRLMPHLRRWKRLTHTGPCEYEDRLTQRQKTGWNRARELAGLGTDVTPHTLKHTSITWLLQAGVPEWEVAGFSGTSPETIRNTYGHHATEHLAKAKAGFHGRNLGRRRKGGQP